MEGGGASNFKFVPFMNHQGDYAHEESLLTDKRGNRIYLSFGPGSYVIPYIIFALFNLPPTVLSLQILNILFHLAGVIMLFLLLKTIWNKDNQQNALGIVFACSTFIFSPGPLWYLGNGYVCTGMMLPFAIGALFIAFKMFSGIQPVTALNIFLLCMLCMITIYIDWYGVFICAGIFFVSLVKRKENKKFTWLALYSFITSCFSVTMIILQFASYAGIEKLVMYWTYRFTQRSIVSQALPFHMLLKNIFNHFITSYFPVLILLFILAAFLLIKSRRSVFRVSKEEKTFLLLCLFSLVPFTLVLLEWSSQHEFSILPYIILLSFLTGFLSLKIERTTILINTILLFLITSTIQYYYINRPGNISIKGEPYNIYQKLGTHIRHAIPKDYKIFINSVPFPITEYYAKRTIIHARSYQDVKRKMMEWKLDKAVWIEEEDYQVKRIVFIKR
jgi:hypothetical protein